MISKWLHISGKAFRIQIYIQFPDILAPSLSAHGSLWTEIPCYTLFGFTATFDIAPQIAVNRH